MSLFNYLIMREIKFRAWMKKEYSLPNAGYDTFTIQELMTGKYDYSKYENWEEFTGLKDKNGKEIYEGDIVKSTNRELGECVAVVGFNEKESAFVLLEGCGWKRPDEFFSTWNKVYKFEVIGNIHQNPELIK